jgi:signal transduction histidine kinase
MPADTASRYLRLLRVIGFSVWVTLLLAELTRLPLHSTRIKAPSSITWFILWIGFGIVLWCSTGLARRGPQRNVTVITVLALQTAIALLMTWVLPSSYVSFLLIVTAWQLALFFPPKLAAWWVLVQTTCMIAIIGPTLSTAWRWAYVATCFSLKGFTYLVVVFARKEAEARAQLATINVEMVATRELLVDSSRSFERLRISRELHDALGHQVTALLLHLEVAVNQPHEAEMRSHILKAQSLAKSILAEVRDVAGTLRTSDQIVDIGKALHALAGSLPNLRVHLVAPDHLDIQDAEQAHALLRCVQEIITNTVKHAHAENLWIAIHATDGVLRVDARDDGIGESETLPAGIGLSGMRERFEQLGGSIHVRPENGTGFALSAWFPLHLGEANS